MKPELLAIVLVVLMVVAIVATIVILNPVGAKGSTTATSTTTSSSRSTLTTTTTSTTSPPFTLNPPNESELIDDSWSSYPAFNPAYNGLDPAYGYSYDGYIANVFQGLVQYNGSDYLHVVPSLASNWTVSTNLRNYTFTMRPNTWFSNKDPVNAYVAWFSFVRGFFTNAETEPYFWNYFDLLLNISSPCTGECLVQEGNYGNINPNYVNNTNEANLFPWGLRQAISHVYNVSLTNESALVSKLDYVLSHFNPSDPDQQSLMGYQNQAIVATNSRTLHFNLLQPYSMFLLDLAPSWGSIVDPTWIDNPENCGGVSNNTICTNFNTRGGPGTGPYMYGTIGAYNSFVTLNANPNYWADGLTEAQLCSQPGEAVCAPVLQPPQIKTILTNYTGSPSTVSKAFDSNQAQLAVVGFEQLDQLYKAYNYSAYYTFNQLIHSLGYYLEETGIGLNGQVFPTNITDFRLAVVHAVNYTNLLAQVYDIDGTQQLAQLFQPPAPPGFGSLDNPNGIKLYTYNLTLAVDYLNESGLQGDFHTSTNITIGNIPAGTILGDPKGQELPPVVFQGMVPLNYTTDIPVFNSEFQPQFNIIASDLWQIGINLTYQVSGCYYGAECTGPGSFSSQSPMTSIGFGASWSDPIFQLFQPIVDPAYPLTSGEYILSASVTNATLSALLQKIPFESNSTQQTLDSARAWTMYSQLAGILQLPLPENYVVAQPYVQGIVYSSFESAYFYNMMFYRA